MSTVRRFAAVLAAAFALMLGLSACDNSQQGGEGQAPSGEQQSQ